MHSAHEAALNSYMAALCACSVLFLHNRFCVCDQTQTIDNTNRYSKLQHTFFARFKCSKITGHEEWVMLHVLDRHTFMLSIGSIPSALFCTNLHVVIFWKIADTDMGQWSATKTVYMCATFVFVSFESRDAASTYGCYSCLRGFQLWCLILLVWSEIKEDSTWKTFIFGQQILNSQWKKIKYFLQGSKQPYLLRYLFAGPDHKKDQK